MPGELSWQTKIVKRLESEGGWGRKWAADYVGGRPDLILVHKDFGHMFMEVKLEPDWRTDTTRTIKLTPLQQIELAKIGEAGGIARVGIVATSPTEKAGDGYLLVMGCPPPGEPLCLSRGAVVGGGLHWKGKQTLADYLRREARWPKNVARS